MHQAFAHDLRIARKKSGLAQRDCAHLLGITQQRVSALETGSTLPTIDEICGLSLIFRRNFSSLFSDAFARARRLQRLQLSTLPNDKRGWLARFNRTNTLSRLADRLEGENPMKNGGV